MDESNSALLSQLRDIHAAAAPGWWPPAPGWWLLAILLTVLLTLAMRWGSRRWQVSRRRRRLLDALEGIGREVDPGADPHEYLARLNRLFRVVALRAFPTSGCARLQGPEWVRFIQSLMPESILAESLGVLASGPYEPSPVFDAGKLRQLAQTWIRNHG
ncbi:MAG TPA: DUF4381 domain-containing protein [Xanthomonadales bacterium]|nr:DUF4381 domain-containing protein [Xanthomonadales bacterium]